MEFNTIINGWCSTTFAILPKARLPPIDPHAFHTDRNLFFSQQNSSFWLVACQSTFIRIMQTCGDGAAHRGCSCLQQLYCQSVSVMKKLFSSKMSVKKIQSGDARQHLLFSSFICCDNTCNVGGALVVGLKNMHLTITQMIMVTFSLRPKYQQSSVGNQCKINVFVSQLLASSPTRFSVKVGGFVRCI